MTPAGETDESPPVFFTANPLSCAAYPGLEGDNALVTDGKRPGRDEEGPKNLDLVRRSAGIKRFVGDDIVFGEHSLEQRPGCQAGEEPAPVRGVCGEEGVPGPGERWLFPQRVLAEHIADFVVEQAFTAEPGLGGCTPVVHVVAARAGTEQGRQCRPAVPAQGNAFSSAAELSRVQALPADTVDG